MQSSQLCSSAHRTARTLLLQPPQIVPRGNLADSPLALSVQSFLKNVKKNLVTPRDLHYSSPPNLTKPMEKLMIRHVLMKLGFLRSALAVGVGIPFVVASVAFAQEPGAPQGPATRAPVPAPNTAANTPTV